MNDLIKQLSNAILLILFFACSLNANPIAPRWYLIDQSGPARYDLKCAYDIQREVTVLFGGVDSASQYFSDTWEWSDGWSRYQTTGPQARIGHGLCYDTLHHVTILFGGQNQSGEYLNDLWTWDGNTWTQIQTNGPSARAFFVFAYDQNRQRAVLYGGIDSSGIVGDTWEWDGSNWLERQVDGPTPRFRSAMAYNISDDNLLLFGGQTNIDSGFVDDTWIFDANGWQNMPCQNHPEARAGHCVESSIFSLGLTLFGGNGDEGYPFGDTWELLDHSLWYSWDFNTPSPRTLACMVCERSTDQILLFGGRDSTRVYNEIWRYPYWGSYIPGDSNCDGIFNGSDVIYSINYLKGRGPAPPYSELCYGQVWYVECDVNNSCSFNGIDITYSVSYFKGGPEPIPCHFCP